jgi:hypothetical protein
MKYLRLALLVFASTLGLARAQDEEERRAPPTEIPDFSNLDEYIYEPKSTVTIGIRHLSGPKTQFAGQGRIVSPEDAGPTTGNNITRNYHDGTVSPDARFVPRVDSSGNPVIDPDSNGQVFDKVAPDGKTNTWAYGDARQASEAPGYMAFHTYSANIVDTATRSLDALSSLGLDLTVTRDMGKLFGTRMTWNLTAGMSANDISAKTSGYVLADRLTRTDYYSLFGQTAPSAPYSAPSSTTQTVLDAAGNTVTNTDGSSQLVSVDTTVLISDQPVASMSSTLRDATSVTSRWKLKGAYYTFRAGPTIWIPITSRFRASFSFGPALVYAGTDYTVTETFTPDIGADLTDTNSSQTYHLMPGYYADANLQFDITERAGLYAGAVFQSAGTYKQNLDAENAHYTTKVDLSNQSGLRAGMTVRF